LKYSRRPARGRRRGSVAFVGIVVRSLAFLALVAACVAAIRWISQEGIRNAELLLPSIHARASDISVVAGFKPTTVQARNRRVVYPYSIVPGGVTSAAELHQAADHDATVGEHYRGFDYSRARVVEVREPRLVYLSYRRGQKVYWTRKQASLHKGEKLLTDGKMTARTRCGNQVSLLPQAQTSPDEPTMAELDRPDAVASGMQSFPSNFDSTLLEVDPGLPIGPASPGGLAGGPVGGTPPGTFIPLPIGGGTGVPVNNGCVPTPAKPCQNPPPPPPPPPPPTVPEPGTILLVASGAAAILARVRKSRS
jgi:PEP-CTERM motif